MTSNVTGTITQSVKNELDMNITMNTTINTTTTTTTSYTPALRIPTTLPAWAKPVPRAVVAAAKAAAAAAAAAAREAIVSTAASDATLTDIISGGALSTRSSSPTIWARPAPVTPPAWARVTSTIISQLTTPKTITPATFARLKTCTSTTNSERNSNIPATGLSTETATTSSSQAIITPTTAAATTAAITIAFWARSTPNLASWAKCTITPATTLTDNAAISGTTFVAAVLSTTTTTTTTTAKQMAQNWAKSCAGTTASTWTITTGKPHVSAKPYTISDPLIAANNSSASTSMLNSQGRLSTKSTQHLPVSSTANPTSLTSNPATNIKYGTNMKYVSKTTMPSTSATSIATLTTMTSSLTTKTGSSNLISKK